MEVKKESRVNPGDIVPGGFSYPNNAVVRGDTLYLRDANGNQIPGRSVSNGDKITVLDVGYSKQLALVQYPTSSGVRQGYVTNATKIIQYLNPYNWVNGSTPEPVYSTPTSNDSNFGTLSPRETATLLYKEGNRYHVVYDTGKGPHTKSGYVNYAGAGGSGGSGGSDSNGIKPGEIVPGGFSYPNNAVVRGDTLYLRDANGNQIPGRSVSNGDHITVLDVGYSKQLALVQYPTSSGVRQGYVTNATKIIQYLTPYNWVNGSTPEPVYSTSTSNDSNFGTLNPREAATLLYKKGNRYHVVYDTGKGPHTKSGYVNYAGTGGSGGSDGSDSNGVKPGEIVPGGFSYPNNAVVRGDTLYLRDANGNQISGRSVSNGDHITVLDVGYSKQLALVQYPTSSGVRQGYVTNATKIIQYLTPYNWVNGSTPEPVYSTSTSNDSNFGTLNPREAATLLYKKGNRYHVVYDTGKGPHTKSGYVNYAGTGGSGGSGNGNDTSIQIPYVSHSQASREQYGTSGKGRPLYAYKIGSGSKVLFAGFALHGWEDNWNNDGLALVKIANELITRLGDYKSKNNGLHGWTVYIAPCMNPDGVIVNGSNKGPGRCTVTTRVDMNRCFPYNFSPQYSSENYTGPNPLGAPEAVALKNFVQKINSQSSEMIVIDCHGWMNFTQGNAQIGKYFGNQFGFGHNNRYSSGFFSSWATTLKNTKGVLLEYPTSTYSYNDVINKNYIGKTFNGIVNILKNNPGSGDSNTPSNLITEEELTRRFDSISRNMGFIRMFDIDENVIRVYSVDPPGVYEITKKIEYGRHLPSILEEKVQIYGNHDIVIPNKAPVGLETVYNPVQNSLIPAMKLLDGQVYVKVKGPFAIDIEFYKTYENEYTGKDDIASISFSINFMPLPGSDSPSFSSAVQQNIETCVSYIDKFLREANDYIYENRKAIASIAVLIGSVMAFVAFPPASALITAQKAIALIASTVTTTINYIK